MKFFAICGLISICCSSHAVEFDTYNLMWDETSNELLVKADLLVTNDTIYSYMDPSVSHIPSGWLNFIEVKSLKHNNNEIKFFNSSSNIIADLETSKVVQVTYSINMKYDQFKWPFGKDEAPYQLGSMMYFIGKAVFLFSDFKRPCIVKFSNSELDIYTSWKKVGEEFLINEKNTLLNSIFVIGEPHKLELQLNGLDVILVSSNISDTNLRTVGELLTDVLEFYQENLKFDLAATNNYCVVINKMGHFSYNGSAYHGGFSLLMPKDPNSKNKKRWVAEIAHELLHNWIGLTLRTSSYEKGLWFTEGFTEYITWHTLLKLGLVTNGDFKRKVGKAKNIYLRHNKNISLIDAGVFKYRYKSFLYEGGFYVAYTIENKLKGSDYDVISLVSDSGKSQHNWQIPNLLKHWAELSEIPDLDHKTWQLISKSQFDENL